MGTARDQILLHIHRSEERLERHTQKQKGSGSHKSGTREGENLGPRDFFAPDPSHIMRSAYRSHTRNRYSNGVSGRNWNLGQCGHPDGRGGGYH
jgi:hypothetical protein